MKKVQEKLVYISYYLVKYTLGVVIKIIWIKKVRGLENIPKKGPVIVVFNHQSYFDFLCYTAISPRKIQFLAAEKFFSHPLWNVLMRMTDQIKVDRTKKDKKDLHNLLHNHLKNGKMIGIFPEGTRSPYKDEMLYGYPGAVKHAINSQAPIIPVGIKGAYNILPKGGHKVKFKKIVEIIIGKPIIFSDYFNLKNNERDFKILTGDIMAHLSKLSGKHYPHFDKHKS